MNYVIWTNAEIDAVLTQAERNAANGGVPVIGNTSSSWGAILVEAQKCLPETRHREKHSIVHGMYRPGKLMLEIQRRFGLSGAMAAPTEDPSVDGQSKMIDEEDVEGVVEDVIEYLRGYMHSAYNVTMTGADAGNIRAHAQNKISKL